VPSLLATQMLVFSGAAAIAFSSLLGLAMLVPLQGWGQKFGRGLNMKQIGAAHLDLIMLGLMQGLAGGMIGVFSLDVPAAAVWAMIFGAWANPAPYVFRAFGVNAFAFGGGPVQRAAAALGLTSSLAILSAWTVILLGAASSWTA
jgi:hypothetical protein